MIFNNIICSVKTAIIHFYLLTLMFLGADALIATGFTTEKLGLSSEIVLTLFVVSTIFLFLGRKLKFHPKLLAFNNKILLPISLLLAAVTIFNHNFPDVLAPLHLPYLPKKIINLAVLACFIPFISQPIRNKKDRWTVAFGPLFLAFSISIYLYDAQLLRVIIREDGPYEYLQAFLYFACFILSFKVYRVLRKRKQRFKAVLFLILALALMFTAFEEISWGQRILDIDTPEFMLEHNTQDEITIHNLEPFQAVLHSFYMLVGFYGAFGSLLLEMTAKPLHKKLSLFLPNKKLGFYFFSVLAFYFFYDFFRTYFTYLFGSEVQFSIWRWQEVAETLLTFGFLLYMLQVKKEVRA